MDDAVDARQALRAQIGAGALPTLRATVTTVTDATGRRFREARAAEEEDAVDEEEAEAEEEHGGLFEPGQFFIIDTSEDKKAHQILSNLYVGSEDAARNLDSLVSNKITHILNVATAVPNFFPERFTYRHLELYDVDDAPIGLVLPLALAFIRDAMSDGGSVLVHCNAGVSRSVSICIAFLLLSGHQASYAAAFEQVRSARPVARPNDGFVKYLRSLKPSQEYRPSLAKPVPLNGPSSG